jgi:hypothetical protein
MVKKVYVLLAWDNEDEKKLVFLCKTQKIASELSTDYKNYVYKHTEIREMKICESFDGARGQII